MVEGPSRGNGHDPDASARVGEILAVGSRAVGSGRIVIDQEARPGEPFLHWQSRAHSIEDIEKELTRIWAEPNLETLVEGEPGRHVAARTSVMNLVVIARRPEIGERSAATIQTLTGKHPSRTLIVSAADPDGPSWLDAQIQAHCVLPRADAPEICAEMIYLSAGGESGRHLDAIVAPLLIHDLPVTIWWPGEPPLGTEPARDLLSMADRLVVDGSTWAEDGLGRLRQLANLIDSTSLSIRDFALVRQSRWREAIASIFDLHEFTPFLRSMRRIAVAYATHDETGAPGSTNLVKPVYHVGWLASRLGLRVVRPLAPVAGHAPPKARPGTRSTRATTKPVLSRGLAAVLADGRSETSVVIRPVVSPMPAGTTLRVELLAERRGSELRADVTAVHDSVHVRVWLDGIESLDRTFKAPRRTDVDLLAEAIEVGGRDPVSDGSIRMAAALAGDAAVPGRATR
ncbi:MAG TPA: glucose-6-phosphate dehydrogenase assembly protein OpcA [Candidatus Limnocylindrales bacterium]|jgi:glucose-6-phosphate dehydrogenase assembly protein OpcA|nr:glucose-6-phosphate dehydrogenase assembly protein OpcA [Candidatus Limnocylindrales bacterium]